MRIAGAGFFLVFLLSGCGIPKDALLLPKENLANRQLQTRRFETNNELKVLKACAALLQDVGFNLDESELDLGVLVASKERSAVNAAEATAAILLSALGGSAVPYNHKQHLRASVITRPFGKSKSSIAVRVTFQRVVWNTSNQITIQEQINDEAQYLDFFDKLSKAIFLEAHSL